ncbi:KAP family P-loop NTPase fold protein [Confluentibacter sediminis]|uniref:KAP family P-loop NTPase fold protein n=1 Tax=Confluentibacter sediminis TaxID=2219045 RepID=UPI000DAB3E6A|nr:P-loop NTPase fold protein [Confluentibacter sediminis]
MASNENPTKLNDKLKKVFDDLKYILFFTSVFTLFSDFVFEYYNKLVISPILSNAKSSILADIIFLIVLASILHSTFKKIKKGYYVKLSQVIFCIIILTIYLYFRISKIELFLSFSTINWLKYFDIPFLLFLAPIILKIIQYSKPNTKPTKNSSRLLLDTSISSSIDDALGRKSKAKRIYKEIQELKSEESIAIGIVGAWGSGKTSFLNLIKENFKDDQHNKNIIIDFNPWLNISLDSIVQDYFNTLESELKQYSVDISKSIKKYGNSVLNLHNNSITESLLKSTNLLFEKNLTDEFKYLNELLKNLNKRVIIFIDDFDRLQANEIFEILKLIRNTGGFDTFTYVVAYDREYLVESLKKHKIPKPQKFSEKIFLKELELLPVTSIQINTYLSKELLKRFEDKKDDINELLKKDISRYSPLGEIKKSTRVLKNFRDVKRFINSFIVDYDEIKNEVLLRDYFILKLIKYKFYNVYALLFSHRDDFITKEDYNFSSYKNPKYILKPKDKTKNSSFDNLFENSKIQDYIENNFSYNNDDLKSIASLLNGLFSTLSSAKNNLSISYEINYYKYFKDELSLNELSIVEFNNVMSLNIEDIKIKMTDWFNNGKLDNAKYYLSDTKVYELQDKSEYEKYIKAMFYMANFESNDIYGKRNKFGFDYDILWTNLNSDNYAILEKFYNNDEKKLSDFLKSILDSAETPYEYESLFCYYIDDRIEHNSKIIEKETVRNYLTYYLKKHTESIDKIDANFWHLLYNCYVSNWESTNGTYWTKNQGYLEEAKSIFKGFITKHLDDTLIIFIQPQSSFRHEKNNKVVLDGLSKSIFGSYQDFLIFLKSPELTKKSDNPSLFLDEFTEFVEEYIKNGENSMEFDFTYYKAIERLNRI